MATSFWRRVPRSPLAVPFSALATLYQSTEVDAAITGAQSYNISSDSTQLTYVGTWRSDTEDGTYQAYSNASDAAVTFSFVGVAVAYTAEKKADRGLCQLLLDGETSYTVDLYNDSGYSQGTQIIWDSGTLVYGAHNVTISQIGPDARFGYYPYLITETWIESVPTNVPAYTATQIKPTPTATQSSKSSSGTSPGPIIGGVIGGVLACFLLGFLFYLWRRDKAQRRRSEGAPVQKVKKADGKMAIEDEPYSKLNAVGSQEGGYGPGGGGWAGGPVVAGAAALGRDSGYGHDHYGGYAGSDGYGAAGAGHYGGQWGQRPGATSDDSHHRRTSYGSPPPPPSSSYPYGQSTSPAPYNYNSTSPYGTMSSQNRSYPYHEQGFGNESRRYPVPEI
ncbi:hypothetical protein JCM10212_004651 [Sporobolomyces blumeae]